MTDVVSELTRIPFTCTLDCGSRCELVACVKDGQVVRIDTPTGQEDTIERPRLIPCVRGRAHRWMVSSTNRVLYPLRRTGARGEGAFERISWDEALDYVAERLAAAVDAHGAQSIFHATGAGAGGGRGFSGASASTRFFSYFGRVTATQGNMSNHCAHMAAQWMLGEGVQGSDRATLLDSKLIILWAMNPAETHMAPNTEHFINRARDRGAHVILVDPRYTDTAILADEWIPIRPGTDAALVAALAYIMDRDGLVATAWMDEHTTGYDAYLNYIRGRSDGQAKTPAWAAEITGVPVERIEYLAHAFGTIKPAALFPGWGAQRALYGEQAARAFITLACMSGNVGVCGGGLASVGQRHGGITVGRLPRGRHAPSRYLPNTTWARSVMEDELDPPLRMAYIVASNLINRSPNTRLNAQALSRFDCIVVHEPFLTPTARYADIVFPINTDLERSDLVTSWGHDSHLFNSQQAISSMGESRSDYWVLAQLAQRLGFSDAFSEGKTESQWLEQFMQSPDLDGPALTRDGIMRTDGKLRVALSEFAQDPSRHPLRTSSGLIEIASPQALDYDLPIIPSYVPQVEPDDLYPLQLVTPHSRLRSNSCLAGNDRLQSLETHSVWISSYDALVRHIDDEQMVEVSSRQGVVRLPAYVTERIMPGVVCIYQGTWSQSEDGVDMGACANILTRSAISRSGGHATHSEWVEIRGVNK